MPNWCWTIFYFKLIFLLCNKGEKCLYLQNPDPCRGRFFSHWIKCNKFRSRCKRFISRWLLVCKESTKWDMVNCKMFTSPNSTSFCTWRNLVNWFWGGKEKKRFLKAKFNISHLKDWYYYCFLSHLNKVNETNSKGDKHIA